MTEVVSPAARSGSRARPAEVVVRGLESFGAFYERERRSMVALAYASSRSRLAAEDIAQDAFVAAFRDWERVGRLDNPATWVRRVVVNRSVSVIRRRIAATRGSEFVEPRVSITDLAARGDALPMSRVRNTPPGR